MKPYIDEENAPELFAMCKYCERWARDTHDYDKCRNMPCIKNWLGYTYRKWETVGNERKFYDTKKYTTHSACDRRDESGIYLSQMWKNYEVSQSSDRKLQYRTVVNTILLR